MKDLNLASWFKRVMCVINNSLINNLLYVVLVAFFGF